MVVLHVYTFVNNDNKDVLLERELELLKHLLYAEKENDYYGVYFLRSKLQEVRSDMLYDNLLKNYYNNKGFLKRKR